MKLLLFPSLLSMLLLCGCYSDDPGDAFMYDNSPTMEALRGEPEDEEDPAETMVGEITRENQRALEQGEEIIPVRERF